MGFQRSQWLTSEAVERRLPHALAYPNLPVRVRTLALSGHGYRTRLPLALGIVWAVALSVLGWGLVVPAGPPRPVPALAVAVLPPLAFTLQELTVRWLAVGGPPWRMVEQPTFRIGLLLQLPFALLAFVAAQLPLRGAQMLGRRLAGGVPPAPTAHSALALAASDPRDPPSGGGGRFGADSRPTSRPLLRPTQAGRCPPAIRARAPLYMGFRSGYCGNQASEDDVTITSGPLQAAAPCTSAACGSSWAADPGGCEAGLDFVCRQRTIQDFVDTRRAMKAAQATYLNPSIAGTDNNGINEYSFVLSRASYRLLPRHPRALPLP